MGAILAKHFGAIRRRASLLAGLVLVTAQVGAEDPESAAARAERAAGLSQEEYEKIAFDGMEAVYALVPPRGRL